MAEYLPLTNSIPYKEKVSVFYDSTIELIERGHSIEALKDVAEMMVQDELWEAAEGMNAALKTLEGLIDD